jgi:hypothetical protein
LAVTHLKNGANDVVIVPNSAIAKMRIQNNIMIAGIRSITASPAWKAFEAQYQKVRELHGLIRHYYQLNYKTL